MMRLVSGCTVKDLKSDSYEYYSNNFINGFRSYIQQYYAFIEPEKKSVVVMAGRETKSAGVNISDDLRCIFIHIPKAAGTSIKQALHLAGQGHPTWQYFAQAYPDKWKAYRKFTVIRNPWDRVVSAYVYARMKESYWHGENTFLHPDYPLLKDKSFEDCCRMLEEDRNSLTHESWHAQYLWMADVVDGKASPMVDVILRYENLDADFARLAALLDTRECRLPHINKTERVAYRDYYDDSTRAIISRVYQADVELFGYKY